MINSFAINESNIDGLGVQLQFIDLQSSLSVAVATFADERATVSVATATFTDILGSISVGAVPPPVDGPIGSIVVSDYKWLTPTLETAQQQFNLRPYFFCKVYDDTIISNQILTSPAQPSNGAVISAPDGSMLAVGKITSTGFLGFWKVSDASQLSQWSTPTTVLDASAGGPVATGYRGDLPVAISVSDYINGSYSIDVYYWSTVGPNIVVKHAFSNDGGVTWILAGGVGGITPNAVSILASTNDNVSLAAGKPYINDDGVTISRSFFYIKVNSQSFYDIHYQFYNGVGSTYGADTLWSGREANSADWTLHSLDVFYKSGIYYIAFAGFHNILESRNTSYNNYGIYTLRLERLTSLATTDVWSAPVEILTSLSPSPANQNSFTVPKFSFDGSNLWLMFNAVTVSTVKNATLTGSVSTSVNYFLCQSKDFLNFTYPSPISFTDGTSFTESADSRGNYPPYSFVLQGTYYYIVGSGQLWQYLQKNVFGDLTNDVLSYSIVEQAGQPSSINTQVGNANNKWYGNTPTEPGASALSKNKKIVLFQGYYNALGQPEVVPRNTYYIDDIQQNVSSNTNDLLISARDWYKKLKTTISRFTFNFLGPLMYADIFDGSTISNWNQTLGSWIEQVNTMTTLSSGGSPGSPGLQDAVVVLSQTPSIKARSIMSVVATLPDPTGSGKHVYVYAYWLDTTHWLRLRITTNGTNFNWYIEKSVGSTITTLDSKTSVDLDWVAGNENYPILVKKYDYYKYNFVIGYNDALNSGNTGTVYNPGQGVHLPLLLANSTNGEFDISANFVGTSKTFTAGTVGFGSNSVQGIFSYFKYFQFEKSQNIKELYQSLGVKTGIFDYKPQTVFEDYLYSPSNFIGTFTTPNRILTMASGVVMKNDEVVSNGEVSFKARLVPTVSSSDYSADFIFRANSFSSPSNYYTLNMAYRASDGRVEARLYIVISGNKLLMSSSTIDYNASPNFNNLNIDLTKFHTYKVLMTDGFMSVFIDGIMVVAWQDNNVVNTYSSGYIGFLPNSNTTFQVKDIVSTTFWNQIDTLSVNPGDDFDQAVLSVANTVRGWNFSDLFGRFKSILLDSADPSTYTYQQQISIQKTDNSDKEFINQITVFGNNGVQAIARDLASIASNGLRENIIVDYKIQTSQDAQNRANSELIDQNKFNNQSTPKQVNNVGAELFDVITLVDDGNNSSGVNRNLRVYGQVIKLGGSSGGSNDDYSIELQTGNL